LHFKPAIANCRKLSFNSKTGGHLTNQQHHQNLMTDDVTVFYSTAHGLQYSISGICLKVLISDKPINMNHMLNDDKYW
jgi:hypothetical protein